MNTIWNGTLRFGQVTIPVGLAPTVAKGGASFRTLHRACGNKTKRGAVCPEHGLVPEQELVKGYEVARGQFVVVEDAELAAVAPEKDHTIPIVACVAPADLDPLTVESRYYLAPGDSPLGLRPYLLLHQALTETGAVALTRFVAFGAEWIATVHPIEDGDLVQGRTLLLEKRCPQEDLVPARDIEKLLAAGEPPDDREATLARQLVHDLKPFRLNKAKLSSDHRARVQQLIEAKLAGQPPIQPAPARAPAQTALTVDLTDALQRSLKRKRAQPTRRRAAH